MAEPFDSATFLEDVSDIAQTQYFREFTKEYPDRFNTVTNSLFDPEAVEVTGTGKVMQVELAPPDTVRMSSDPLGPFAAPDTLEPATLTVRFNKQTTTSSDFSEVSASVQVDDIDIQEAGKGSIVDFVERVYDAVQPNYDEHLAVLRHATRTAQIAQVNGTPKLNNSFYLSGASSTATNAGGLRVAVDNGSIAAFRRGTRLDFVTSSGVVHAGNVRVTDVNPADLSIGVAFTSTGIAPRASTGNLANVVDNDLIVFSGEFNKGIYSMGAYFGRPSTGDSFIGGADRTDAAKRWLLPTAINEGSSTTRITKSMFNSLAIAMGFRSPDTQTGMVFMSDPTIHQALRDDIGEDAFIQLPTDDSRMRRFAHFGNIGLTYQHGQFGVVKIAADPLCPSNCVRVIAPQTWKSLYYGWRGLRMMPGDVRGWYRLNEPTPNQGKGKIWKCDWYALQADWCTQPWLNGIILNVSN